MIDEYQVFVDGKPEDPAMVMFHYQEQPFPGGRSYRISIKNREAIEEFRKRYSDGVHDYPDALDNSYVLDFVNLLLSLELKAAKYAQEIRVWINNIHRMEVHEDEVQLVGECSDHVT